VQSGIQGTPASVPDYSLRLSSRLPTAQSSFFVGIPLLAGH
jgi:hypothetical protein